MDDELTKMNGVCVCVWQHRARHSPLGATQQFCDSDSVKAKKYSKISISITNLVDSVAAHWHKKKLQEVEEQAKVAEEGTKRKPDIYSFLTTTTPTTTETLTSLLTMYSLGKRLTFLLFVAFFFYSNTTKTKFTFIAIFQSLIFSFLSLSLAAFFVLRISRCIYFSSAHSPHS